VRIKFDSTINFKFVMYAIVMNLVECLSIHICVTKSMHPLNLGLQPAWNSPINLALQFVRNSPMNNTLVNINNEFLLQWQIHYLLEPERYLEDVVSIMFFILNNNIHATGLRTRKVICFEQT
jgi:hypothetical protein